MKKQVVVIGLGRFGASVARSLYNLGDDVLAIDKDESRVQSMVGQATHALAADATNEAVLRELGIPGLRRGHRGHRLGHRSQHHDVGAAEDRGRGVRGLAGLQRAAREHAGADRGGQGDPRRVGDGGSAGPRPVQSQRPGVPGVHPQLRVQPHEGSAQAGSHDAPGGGLLEPPGQVRAVGGGPQEGQGDHHQPGHGRPGCGTAIGWWWRGTTASWTGWRWSRIPARRSSPGRIGRSDLGRPHGEKSACSGEERRGPRSRYPPFSLR